MSSPSAKVAGETPQGTDAVVQSVTCPPCRETSATSARDTNRQIGIAPNALPWKMRVPREDKVTEEFAISFSFQEWGASITRPPWVSSSNLRARRDRQGVDRVLDEVRGRRGEPGRRDHFNRVHVGNRDAVRSEEHTS